MKTCRILFASLTVFLVLLPFGCSPSTGPIQSQTHLGDRTGTPMDIANPCGLVTTVTLLAGRTIDVGTVVIANDGERLCVTYNTSGAWLLTENHLDIALTPDEIPQTNSGNPRPGQFSYSHILTVPVQMDEHCFTLAELGYEPGAVLYVAAHSKVVRMEGGRAVQSETAWGDGLPFPGANWATYMEHTIQTCGGGGGE
jgi:hypothetical protein